MLPLDGVSVVRVLGLYAWRRMAEICDRQDAIQYAIIQRSKLLPEPERAAFIKDQQLHHQAEIWQEVQAGREKGRCPGRCPWWITVLVYIVLWASLLGICWLLLGNPLDMYREV
jgi:hypothetical protein